MSKQRFPFDSLVLSLALLVGLGSGCDDAQDDEGEQPSVGVYMAGLGTCTSTGNRRLTWPAGAERVVVRVTDGEREQVATFDDSSASEVIVRDVVPGEDLRVEVVGCVGSELTWAGEATGVTVESQTKSFPTVFLTPVGQPACIGTPGYQSYDRMTVPRAFSAAVSGHQGAYLLGGFNAYTPAPSYAATATATVDHYEASVSAFMPAGELKSARGMASAVSLPDGRVRIVGGATELLVPGPFSVAPLWANGNDAAPTCAVEIFDPTTGSSECEGADRLPALPSIGVSEGGVILAVGGVEADDGAAQGVAADSAMWISAAGETAMIDLPHGGRVGATVVPLSEQDFLVWGGNVDGAPESLGLLVNVDGAESVTVAATPRAVPFFAAGHVLGQDASGHFRVLIAGGSDIDASGTYTRDVLTARLELLRVDLAGAAIEAVDLPLGDQEGNFRRAAGSLHAIGAGELWWFGGFTAFKQSDLCATTDSCLQDGLVRFTIKDWDSATPQFVSVSADDVSPVGPFGSSAVPLDDGSWLVAGGMSGIASSNVVDAAATLWRFGARMADLCQK